MARNIERLIETFETYYDRKENYKEATALVESLCFACRVSPDFPRYHTIGDIDIWYERVVEWLFEVNILQ